MAINPYRKGGTDVPVTDGGTNASDAAAALANLGGLDTTSHGAEDHTAGPLNLLDTTAHALVNHAGIPGVGLGKLVQFTQLQDGAVASGPTTIPFDNTVPLKDEGDLFMSHTHTPLNAANILLIEVDWFGAGAASNTVVATLYHPPIDATPVLACGVASAAAGLMVGLHFNFRVVAGGTSELTFNVSAGGAAVGGAIFNGVPGPTALLGGSLQSAIRIFEFEP